MRTIEVGGIQYHWRVGKSNVLIENRDFNLKWTPTLVEATLGYHDHRDFEKGNASITPSMISRYIEKHTSVFRDTNK